MQVIQHITYTVKTSDRGLVISNNCIEREYEIPYQTWGNGPKLSEINGDVLFGGYRWEFGSIRLLEDIRANMKVFWKQERLRRRYGKKTWKEAKWAHTVCSLRGGSRKISKYLERQKEQKKEHNKPKAVDVKDKYTQT